MSSLEKNLLRKEFNRLTPRPLATAARSGARSSRHQRDFKPLSYKSYFDSFELIKTPGSEETFRVYLSGFQSHPSDSLLLVLLHGGGYSGLTWSLFTKHIRELCVCRIASIDLRGHGGTQTEDETDLSTVTLIDDIGFIIKSLLELKGNDEEPPPIVIVGHSMGGALAVHCAVNFQDIPSIVGIIVIDVVEGTALDALQSMQSFLKGRPKSFPSLENAIEWWSGQTRNLEAAKVSMPGQLKNRLTNKLATEDILDEPLTSGEDVTEISQARRLFASPNDIPEEQETSGEEPQSEPEKEDKKEANELCKNNEYVWRINLSETEPHWKGWFQGLSELFLSAPVQGKLLLLAGIDNLDRQLTIGQMQGKFQLQVLPQCGHAVHEDNPEKVADTIATFLVRNRFTQAIREFDRPFPSC